MKQKIQIFPKYLVNKKTEKQQKAESQHIQTLQIICDYFLHLISETASCFFSDRIKWKRISQFWLM